MSRFVESPEPTPSRDDMTAAKAALRSTGFKETE